MIQSVSADELLFFDSKQQALPLYMAFREAVLGRVPHIGARPHEIIINFIAQNLLVFNGVR